MHVGFTQGRTNDGLIDDARRRWQGTCFENVRKVFSFLDLCVEFSSSHADAGATTGDLALYDRSTVDQVVEDDGNGFPDIVARHHLPGLRTFGVHLHDHLHITLHIEVLGGIDDRASVQFGLSTTGYFQGIEVHHADVLARLKGTYLRLGRPSELEVLRQSAHHSRGAQETVHLRRISQTCGTDHRTGTEVESTTLASHDVRGQHIEERVLLGEVLLRGV